MKLGEEFQKVDIKSKELYRFYKKNCKKPVSYSKYMETINIYNKKAVEAIIDGQAFYFGEGLSFIRIVEWHLAQTLDKQGNPKRRINWVETNKLNKKDSQGKTILIYYIDDNPGYKIKWFTGLALSSQIRVWKFAPCKGFRQKVRKAFCANPFQGNKYKYIKKHTYDI